MKKHKRNNKNNSFFKEVKNVFSERDDNFPWFYSGILLVGFTLGVLVTAGVDIISRTNINQNEEVATSDLSEKDKCIEKGGRYDSKEEKCLMVTNDGSDDCTDKADCEGWCLADADAELRTEGTGTCSDEFQPKGCFKFMDKGSVNEICLD